MSRINAVMAGVSLLVCCPVLQAAAVETTVVSGAFSVAGMGKEFYRPLVSDKGGVAFLAPRKGTDPTLDQMNAYRHEAGMWQSIFPEVSDSSMPWEEMYVCELMGNAALSSFAGIQFQGGRADGIFLSWTDSLGETKASLLLNGVGHESLGIQDLSVAYAPKAQLFMVNGGGYSCVPAVVSPDGGKISLGNRYQGVHEPSTFSTALSADGRYLFYSSAVAPAAGTPGFISSELLSLYRYDRTKELSVFLGQSGKRTQDPELSCSSDGRSVAYVSHLDSVSHGVAPSQIVHQTISGEGLVSSARMISRWNGELAVPVSDESLVLKRLPCGSPMVSADGLFVVFGARTMNFPGGGAGSSEQVYRYDVSSGELEWISQGGAGVCAVPSVSPNGRMIAFVNRTSENESQVLLADCGPSLSVPELQETVPGAFELSIVSSARGQFRLLLADDTVAHGCLIGADGTPLSLGTWYDVRLLPVRYETEEVESFALTVEVRDSEASPVLSGRLGVRVTIPWSLEPVSVNQAGRWPSVPLNTSYDSLGLSEDGQVVLFTTGADLLGELGAQNRPHQKLYVRRFRQGTWQTERLSGPGKTYGQPVGRAALSGDGKVAVFVHDGKLIRLELEGEGAEIATVTGAVSQVAADVTGEAVVWLEDGALKRWTRTAVTTISDKAGEFALSRDGRTVVYITDGTLWGKTDGMEAAELQSGLSDPHVSGLSLSGHRVYYTAGERLYGLDFGGEPVELGGFAGASKVRVSSNGRVALYTKVADGIGQLYLRRLGTSSVADVLVSSPDGVTTGNGWSDSLLAPARMSADGQVVVFASQAGNLVEGDMNGAQDLFRWTDLEFKPEQATMEIVGKGTEDQTLALSILPVSEQGSNVVLSLAKDLPVGTKAVTLLPPSQSQGAYQLQLEPSQDFCGICTVKLTVFDGRKNSDTTATLTIENVNDAPYWKPEATMGYVCDEGDSLEVDLSVMADDVDLQNPDNEEALSFGTGEAPEDVELTLEKGKLTVKVGYDAVNRTTEELPLKIAVTVADREKLSAEATLQLKVRNVNRLPRAQVLEIVHREGEELYLGQREFTDPDEGDVLSYVFTVTEGTLRDGKGQTIVSGETVSAERLPVKYEAAEGRFNTATFAVKAVDESEAQSAEVTVMVSLKRQAQSVANLWGGSVDGSGKVAWSGLSKGWNLLAVPMELKGEDYRSFVDWLKPVAIWRWNGKARRYEQGTGLDAQEGFWVYLEHLPQAMDTQLRGTLGEPWPARLGWQLMAPSAQSGLEFSYEQKTETLIRGRSGKPGQGVWRYGKEAGRR